jgi:hypothetical protein
VDSWIGGKSWKSQSNIYSELDTAAAAGCGRHTIDHLLARLYKLLSTAREAFSRGVGKSVRLFAENQEGLTLAFLQHHFSFTNGGSFLSQQQLLLKKQPTFSIILL